MRLHKEHFGPGDSETLRSRSVQASARPFVPRRLVGLRKMIRDGVKRTYQPMYVSPQAFSVMSRAACSVIVSWRRREKHSPGANAASCRNDALFGNHKRRRTAAKIPSFASHACVEYINCTELTYIHRLAGSWSSYSVPEPLAGCVR